MHIPVQHHEKTPIMTQLAAGFAAKGLLFLMTSSSVATGLAHPKCIIRSDQMLTRRAMFRYITCYLFVHDSFQPLQGPPCHIKNGDLNSFILGLCRFCLGVRTLAAIVSKRSMILPDLEERHAHGKKNVYMNRRVGLSNAYSGCSRSLTRLTASDDHSQGGRMKQSVRRS